MLKEKDIVIISLASWSIDIGSNSKDIALELAKKNRVLYVDRALDRITVFKKTFQLPIRKRKGLNITTSKSKIQLIQTNLWNLAPNIVLESINYLPPGKLYDYLNFLNHKRFALEIKSALLQLGFENVIIFNDNDFFRGYYLKKLLQPSYYIYYLRDFLTSKSYFKKHGIRLETSLIKKSDLVVTNSQYLADYASQHNPNTFNIGQGVNLLAFNKPFFTKPITLQGFTTPIIGYVGALTSERLDIELIAKLATSFPKWQVLLVGPQDALFLNSCLHQIPNIHFMGPVPPSEVPDYIAHCDVCINPQKLNEHTLGNYPRKVDEYLALGKPVVSVETNTMQMFREYVYLAESHEEFIVQVSRAFSENSDDLVYKRNNFANSHSWKDSVTKLSRALSNIKSRSYE